MNIALKVAGNRNNSLLTVLVPDTETDLLKALHVYAKASPDSKERIPICDPAIIVNAIVHIIDRVSGREPVYDPAADRKIEQKICSYCKDMQIRKLGVIEKTQLKNLEDEKRARA
jgi:hypothetical protein